ncbi:hypothetical protein DAT35_47175 [Vitiosangium sp. GDMCC 1.1324]|nr:hypothetical protein DAT35_47175 [Vitiosangium sp. GDMCC 1.1324]
MTKLIVPLLIGTLAACTDPDAGPVTVAPKTATVKAGDKTTFTATVKDAKESKILWSVEGGDSHGTISSAGVYTAPTEAGTYTVVATNAVDSSKKDTATVTVEPAVVVRIAPLGTQVVTGGTATFTAKVTGAEDTSVTWSIQEGEAGGSITAEGVYTAPATAGTYTIVATSVADPTRKGTAEVTVTSVSVKLSPETKTSDQGATTAFISEVTGTRVTAVTWSVEGGDSNGTITSAGVYTAPNHPGSYTVWATSVADPSKKASATITVPVASGIGYQDPVGIGWRLVKNAAASTDSRLVLDLVGPEGQSGRGVDLTLSVDSARASWTKVSDADTEYVANRAFDLGSAPQLFKGGVKADTLSVGVYQKDAPAKEYTGALISVALDLKGSDSLPAGTRVPLSVVKAHALPDSGTLASINVAVGAITTR